MKPQWEAMVRLDGKPAICPVHLMQTYVALTAAYVPAGSLLLRQLKPPCDPLTANNVGSITKNALRALGVPVDFWGPHSTRGAGVLFYKKLGMTSEEVCEIGKWKNVGAFSAHYLRLGAAQRAGERLSALVHTVSPGQSAEPDRSRSPETEWETGRSDREGEAQRPGEPAHPLQENETGHSVPSAPQAPLWFEFSRPRAPSDPKRPLSSSSAGSAKVTAATASPGSRRPCSSSIRPETPWSSRPSPTTPWCSRNERDLCGHRGRCGAA